ncbi:putative RNA methyltransferase [Alkalimonas amylolytica]|uniref:23S rRNA (Guanine745-N1)-methyltransferase n=1 Tax=Alkalimonas amylolytica TaxID=152573 RepID=A0A1H4CHB7_ALKAM|nr:methyltransferase domain-containing protein [Alkalimonas amylolytica]SEA59713.1 23S rRNA (guanine745-N1)-methyltransferase [Alkalimonas amylolytica]
MTSTLPYTSTLYRCPLCQEPLTPEHSEPKQISYRCVNRHHFDVAKEGYLNLLPVQHKNSKQPGDSKAMLQQRRQFLESGAYQPLVSALAEQLQHLAPVRMLDSGCGEGYYSAQLKAALPATEFAGMDISKSAIQLAAKRYPDIAFCVASAKALPYGDQQFDGMLVLCAPFELAEVKRCLRPSGYLMLVTAAPEHLLQFKQAIYKEVRLHSDAVQALAGFKHLQRQHCRFMLQHLGANAYLSLLDMTPLGWKLPPEQKQQLCQSLTQLQADFYIDSYQYGS